MHRISGCIVAGLLGVLLTGTGAHASDKIEVKPIHYDQLGKTIKELHGKVVVVDFWADY